MGRSATTTTTDTQPARHRLKPARGRLTSRIVCSEAEAAETALPAPSFLFAQTAQAFFHRHGIASCTEPAIHVMDAELQRMLRHVTEIAYHAATAAGRSRLTRRDFGFAWRQFKRSAVC